MDEPIVPTLVDSVPPDPAPADPVADTPSPAPTDAPAEAPKAPADQPAAEPQLFDLPDGRKVDAATLAKVWKEDFLPDYTRKSQKIAEIERPKEINNAADDVPAWQKPDYVPSSYKEVIEIATEQAIERLSKAAQEEEAQVKAVTEQVDRTLMELKASDPTLNEDALFQHAVKYGFRDLKAAHANMIDMRSVIKDTEQRVLKNLKTRESDPVAGGSVPSDGSIDPNARSSFRSAQEFLSHIKGS